MREKYIDLMEKSLSAYSYEHILRYFGDVKENGLTEHGFPRLAANIGILIAHGKRMDLFDIFMEMMEFCCKTMPHVKAANDFSIREIISCLWEVEKSEILPKETTERWREYLCGVEVEKTYDCFVKTTEDNTRNWVLFTALSEFFRQKAELCENTEFIELQLEQQLRWFDENGMYRDNIEHERQQPIMYDLVPRGLFSLLLDQGYRGKHYETIDAILKKAGLLTLDMQSPNGEMGFGGRSNQFVHNEAWMTAILEYEAKRYMREGNTALASRFKSAVAKALAVTELWLNKEPIRHIKNRYPTETKYGCEFYAYFDKYMITVASNLWAAYLICDDSIPLGEPVDYAPCVMQTSDYFDKLFVKAGGYGLEFDLFADTSYDANGLGRLVRDGAPSAICMSCPCPKEPSYTVDIPNPVALSLCSAIRTDEGFKLGADSSTKYEVVQCNADDYSASTTLNCLFDNNVSVREHYTVDQSGVSVTLEGNGEIGFVMPAFCFDGELEPQIDMQNHVLTIRYENWKCVYTTDGDISEAGGCAANRNGHYRIFVATAQNVVNTKIEIAEN